MPFAQTSLALDLTAQRAGAAVGNGENGTAVAQVASERQRSRTDEPAGLEEPASSEPRMVGPEQGEQDADEAFLLLDVHFLGA